MSTTITKTRGPLVRPETEEVEAKLGTLSLRGSATPLELGTALNAYKRTDVTPTIGTEFERGVQLSQILKSPDRDVVLRDLAILGTWGRLP